MKKSKTAKFETYVGELSPVQRNLFVALHNNVIVSKTAAGKYRRRPSITFGQAAGIGQILTGANGYHQAIADYDYWMRTAFIKPVMAAVAKYRDDHPDLKLVSVYFDGDGPTL